MTPVLLDNLNSQYRILGVGVSIVMLLCMLTFILMADRKRKRTIQVTRKRKIIRRSILRRK